VQVLFGAIIIPYGFLIAGVVEQATNPQYAEPRQAVYASALLLALMTVYTAGTVICLWVFHCVQAQESEASKLQEVEWQPHDMMFFLVGARGWQGAGRGLGGGILGCQAGRSQHVVVPPPPLLLLLL
jgi:hypothetical protein